MEISDTLVIAYTQYVLSHSIMSNFLWSRDCGPPGSSVYGILQVRILEWVAISSSRDLPDLRTEPASPVDSVLAGGFFYTEPPGKPISYIVPKANENSCFSKYNSIFTSFPQRDQLENKF